MSALRPCSHVFSQRLRLMFFFACLYAVGCDGTSANENADAGIGCREDPRGETYTANMEKAGSLGVLTFLLERSDPAPPAKGTNVWNVSFSDSSGTPLVGADVEVTPYMPDHGHGTSVVPRITTDGNGYIISPLYLFMGGLWQITLDVEKGSIRDSAVFTFCVQG